MTDPAHREPDSDVIVHRLAARLIDFALVALLFAALWLPWRLYRIGPADACREVPAANCEIAEIRPTLDEAGAEQIVYVMSDGREISADVDLFTLGSSDYLVDRPSPAAYLVTLGYVLVVFVLLQGTRGTTPGKALTRIRLAREAGGPAGIGKAFARWLLPDGAIGLVGVAFGVFTNARLLPVLGLVGALGLVRFSLSMVAGMRWFTDAGLGLRVLHRDDVREPAEAETVTAGSFTTPTATTPPLATATTPSLPTAVTAGSTAAGSTAGASTRDQAPGATTSGGWWQLPEPSTGGADSHPTPIPLPSMPTGTFGARAETPPPGSEVPPPPPRTEPVPIIRPTDLSGGRIKAVASGVGATSTEPETTAPETTETAGQDGPAGIDATEAATSEVAAPSAETEPAAASDHTGDDADDPDDASASAETEAEDAASTADDATVGALSTEAASDTADTSDATADTTIDIEPAAEPEPAAASPVAAISLSDTSAAAVPAGTSAPAVASTATTTSAATAAASTTTSTATVTEAPPQYQPQWDPIRRAYICWEPASAQWMQWDDAAKTWGPISQ